MKKTLTFEVHYMFRDHIPALIYDSSVYADDNYRFVFEQLLAEILFATGVL